MNSFAVFSSMESDCVSSRRLVQRRLYALTIEEFAELKVSFLVCRFLQVLVIPHVVNRQVPAMYNVYRMDLFFPSEMYLCMGDVFAHWRCICALEMYLRIADVFANVFFVWRVFGI